MENLFKPAAAQRAATGQRLPDGTACAGSYTSEGVCYLDTNTTNTRMCVYAYFVAGVSMLATILFSLLLVRAHASAAAPLGHAPAAALHQLVACCISSCGVQGCSHEPCTGLPPCCSSISMRECSTPGSFAYDMPISSARSAAHAISAAAAPFSSSSSPGWALPGGRSHLWCSCSGPSAPTILACR